MSWSPDVLEHLIALKIPVCDDCYTVYSAAHGSKYPLYCSCGICWVDVFPPEKTHAKLTVQLQKPKRTKRTNVNINVDEKLKTLLFDLRSMQISVVREGFTNEASNIGFVLDALTLGCVGDGNSGTKGTGRKSQQSIVVHIGSSIVFERYNALNDENRVVCDLIIDDGCSPLPRVVQLSGKQYNLSFYQRIGLKYTNYTQPTTYQNWLYKLHSNDPSPALTGSLICGVAVVDKLKSSWF